jgi:BirA family biotin operon repressor/biotin-[acetyl-CoA-carboxylase] ligase
VVLDEVDSTNDELKRQGCDLLIAARQTAGRGRLGRPWSSPPGGIYMSLLVRPQCSIQQASALPLLTALGVYEAIGCSQAAIKWPNDIICGQGKLTGILVEAWDGGYIIGIGLNVQRVVDDHSDAPAAYLSDLGAAAQVEELAAAVVNGVIRKYNGWRDEGFCFQGYMNEYNNRLAMRGEAVRISSIDGSLVASGRLLGVDANGYLLVDDQGKITSVAAGDITLRS